MFALQTRDLYHIEADRKSGSIEFAEGKYIEPSQARRVDNGTIAFVATNAGLVMKRGQRV
jgi:hypothetical protein